MRELIINYLKPPPEPYEDWSKDAINHLLIQAGFDLTRDIEKSEDSVTCGYTATFRQGTRKVELD